MNHDRTRSSGFTRAAVLSIALFSSLSAPGAVHAQSISELSYNLSNGQYLDLYDQSRVTSNGSQIVGTEYTLDPSGTVVTSAQAVTLTGTSNVPTELGYLTGDSASYGFGISSDGSTVVGASVGTVSQAVEWTSGGLAGLGTLSGYTDSVAYGASTNGSVITGVATNSATNASQVFRWTASGGMTTLGALPSGYSDTSIGPAYGNTISGDGATIVGDLSSPTGATATQSFIWTASGGVAALGVQSGGTYSITAAVSNDGTAVVGYGDNASGNQTAYRWKSTTGMTSLGMAYTNFQANATSTNSNSSLIVGDYFHTNSAGTIDYESGYVYNDMYGYADIRDYLQNTLGMSSALAGWTDLDVDNISIDGTTIFGDGEDPSGNYAYWKAYDPKGFTSAYTESPQLAAILGQVVADDETPEPGALALLLPFATLLSSCIWRSKSR